MSAFYNKIKSISDSAYQQCKEEVISQICPKIDDLMLNNASTHSGVTVVFPLSGHAYGTSPGVSNVIYIHTEEYNLNRRWCMKAVRNIYLQQGFRAESTDDTVYIWWD